MPLASFRDSKLVKVEEESAKSTINDKTRLGTNRFVMSRPAAMARRPDETMQKDVEQKRKLIPPLNSDRMRVQLYPKIYPD